MFKILLLFTEHFFLPALFLFWQWKRLYKSKFDGIFMSLLVGVYIFFIYKTGDWHIYGYYFRYFWAAAFLIVFSRTIYAVRRFPFWVSKNPRERFGIYFIGLFILIFAGLDGWAFWGGFIRAETVSLVFPLKNGKYYLIEGGNSPLINNHHHFFPLPEKYSVEIVKLDKSGKYGRSFFPDNLEDFEIFGKKVYSPCMGVVVSVVDSLPDLAPSTLEKKQEVFFGNFVTIDYKGFHIVLSRLKENSINVREGDTLEAGQAIGEVGNSGFIGGPFSVNVEPHLHIHATRKTNKENFPFEREGVPLRFDGHFLIKNTLVTVP
jgi:hypothetical protein